MRKLFPLLISLLLLAAPLHAASGTIAALNDAVTAEGLGTVGVAGFLLTGTCTTGEVSFEGTVDGTTWASMNAFPPSSSSGATVATAAGTWTASVGGFRSVRLRVSDACDANNFVGTITLTQGSATVAGAGGGGDGAVQDGVNPAIEATVVDYTNSNPLTVRLSDTNGDYVAAGAGTQYTEDAAAAANPVAGALIVVRNDARSGSLVTTDGDNVAVRGTNNGEIYVKQTDAVTVTDGAGALNTIVDSGTVTANAGTNLNTSALALETGGNLATIASYDSRLLSSAVPAAHGAASATTGFLIGGIYNATPPTFTDTQQGGIQLDSAGRVLTSGATTITEGGVTADVLDLTNNNPIAMAIVDSNGDQVSSFGGGTEYAEDTAHVSGDELKLAGVVQQTADTALAANGDRTLLQVDSNGFLKVNIKAGAGSGGTAAQDNSGFTGGTTNVTPFGAIYDTTPPSITDGNVGAVRMNSNRQMMVEVAAVTAAGPVDDTATLTPTTTEGTPIMAAATADSVDNGDLGIVGMTTGRALFVAQQGTATVSGTVTANAGTNLNTSTLLTTTAHDAAFGTAGTADSQVRSIQGIASMTPVTVSATNLDVQIGGSDSLTIGTLPALAAGDNDVGNFDMEFAGTAAATGNGSANAQTQRVIHATDDPAVTSLALLDNIAGGLSYISVGTTEDEHAVKASAGTLWSIAATNTAATVAYLKCENDTAAGTAPGTDTPEFRFAIPGATTGGGFQMSFPRGFSFSTALTCWIVTGAADSDVAEVAANAVMVFYTFE